MQAKKPLTDRAIVALKPAPKGKRSLIWDALVPGLAVRVTDKGQRSFVLVTRYPGSRNPAPAPLARLVQLACPTLVRLLKLGSGKSIKALILQRLLSNKSEIRFRQFAPIT
jgi:hypothetical protein